MSRKLFLAVLFAPMIASAIPFSGLQNAFKDIQHDPMAKVPARNGDVRHALHMRAEAVKRGCDPFTDKNCADQMYLKMLEEEGHGFGALKQNASTADGAKLRIFVDTASKVQKMVVIGDPNDKNPNGFTAKWFISSGLELEEAVMTDSGYMTNKHTPTGKFSIQFMEIDHQSGAWGTKNDDGEIIDGADMPLSMCIGDGVCIHSPGWPTKDGSNEPNPEYVKKAALLGKRQSGGCIRLQFEDVSVLYNMVAEEYGRENVEVYVINSEIDGIDLPPVDAPSICDHSTSLRCGDKRVIITSDAQAPDVQTPNTQTPDVRTSEIKPEYNKNAPQFIAPVKKRGSILEFLGLKKKKTDALF
jgi:hypothetical protein